MKDKTHKSDYELLKSILSKSPGLLKKYIDENQEDKQVQKIISSFNTKHNLTNGSSIKIVEDRVPISKDLLKLEIPEQANLSSLRGKTNHTYIYICSL